MQEKIDLSIIIVSYNGSFWLKKTLESLKEFYLDQTTKRVAVYLVDNASTDDVVVMTRQNFPFVQIIELEKNLGFAAANNRALKEISSDYVMLLNPDTQLDERSRIDLLLDYLSAHQEVGMIGPKLLLTDGRLDPACHRGEPNPWAAACYFLRLEKLWPRWRLVYGYHRGDLDMDKIHSIEAISGAAMIVPRSALEVVGLLDERFFLYAEDLDWARRFREAGYQIIYDPECIIIHHKNKTGIANQDAQISGKSREYFFNTMLQYYDKYYADKLPKFMRRLVQSFLFVKKEGW